MTMRKLEIADGSAFAEKLGVGHNGAVGIRAGFTDDALDLIAGANGNG
jgi:hypothetical protein